MERLGRWLSIVLACALPLLAAAAADAAEAPATLQVGTQTLTLCTRSPVGYCGTLAVPLDYSSPEGPSISIAYRWYPASEGAARGTVVPVEGGPGYPSIGSVRYSEGGAPAGYAPMYGPLLAHFNMLAVDNRGTGASVPLRCDALQEFSGPSGTAAFQQTVGECAEQLNHRWRYPDGAFVHASDLFTSAPAAEDLAAVIRALGIGKVDLYGDSYGSYFAQVFASRYPHLLRSLILDSTYQTVGLEAWYRSSIEAMPGDFQTACSRAPACVAAEPGSVWQTFGALAASLRAQPLSGVVPGPTGALEHVTMGVVGLVNLVSDAAEDQQIYRDLDAAARALLDEGDAAPLLRLYAQRLAVDEAYFGLPVREYSVELYFAVGCLDYPQLFDMDAAPAQREAELAAAVLALPAGTFSPFTTAEWLSQDENTEAYTGCLQWPAPTIAQPPTVTPPPLLGSSSKLPVLALGGELDTWTPPREVPTVLGDLGGDSRLIVLANSTHVVGEGDTVCGSELIRAFVERPQDLQTMDASCAAAVPAIHSVGTYPATLAGEQPLDPSPGSQASSAQLELAAAAVQTAGDAIARYEATEASSDHGLHGGTVTVKGSLLTLEHDRLVPGVPVSGTVKLSPSPIAEDGDIATATLSATGAGKMTLSATWTTAGTAALAQVAGSVGRVAVAGTMPAP